MLSQLLLSKFNKWGRTEQAIFQMLSFTSVDFTQLSDDSGNDSGNGSGNRDTIWWEAISRICAYSNICESGIDADRFGELVQ